MAMDFDSLLKTIQTKHPSISDIHFKAGRPPMVRTLGQLTDTAFPKLNNTHTASIARVMMNDYQHQQFQKKMAFDFSYTIANFSRYRVNAFYQRGSIEIIMRIVPLRIPKIEELSLPEILKKISLEERGLVLVTGSAGCGKSTTLASMINHSNENCNDHIITVEDPIEFVYQDIKASVNQIEVGTDVQSFMKALRSSLRQDPDIILVGEMRDIETIDTAIKAAETGHLVFSTLHTTDAVSTIYRIIDTFPPHQQQQVRYQLASNLKSIICQRLIPRADGRGRIPAVEVLITTVMIQNQIIDSSKTAGIRDTIMRGRGHYGMQTIDQHLTDLYSSKIITLETALEAASNPSDFQRALQFE